ncbi:MAG: cellulase family glycosylhydrolase [Cyclobacteriaceae bacterium]
MTNILKHRIFTLICLVALIPLSCNQVSVNPTNGGYIHASGKKIVDGNENPLILKGIGLGGWMVQEGYMLGTHGPQHEIREYLESMAGKAATDDFYESWLSNFVNQNDIYQIAKWGYNSVRLPLHYDLFFSERGQWMDHSKGLELTDKLLSWCEAAEIYLILDLHAAPGGQGNNQDISDRRNGESLWEDTRFVEMTKTMWFELADHYKNESWIGGYDLLNEPNYDFENTGNTKGCTCRQNIPLRELYEELIDGIRAIDKNHLLIIEGNCYGSNYQGLESLANYDTEKNLAYSFHNYWGSNTPAAMQSLITLRNELNIPLWRGEIGENSNTWFTEMVELMEVYQIGYANWPWKKIHSIDGPAIVPSHADWDKLMAYKTNNSRPRPTTSEAQNALKVIAENIKLENVKLMEDVAYAYLKSPYGEGTTAYADHKMPGILYATDYDLGKREESWFDTDYQNTSGSSSNTAWNRGESYRNDGVDIWPSSDAKSNGFYVGHIKSGEFLVFSMSSISAGTYNITVRARANQNREGKLNLMLDGSSLTNSPITISRSSTWQDVVVTDVNVPDGEVLRLRFDQGDFDLASIEFQK